jgi:hypothetical protein
LVFKVDRNGATYRVDMDAATSAVLGTEEIHLEPLNQQTNSTEAEDR